MNGYKLVAQLLEARMTDAAGELSKLLAEREEEAPRLKALEYELAWLRQFVWREGYAAAAVKYSEDGEETPLAWEHVKGPTTSGMGRFVVLRGNPRLEAILDGKLPSLDAFREGRTP